MDTNKISKRFVGAIKQSKVKSFWEFEVIVFA